MAEGNFGSAPSGNGAGNAPQQGQGTTTAQSSPQQKQQQSGQSREQGGNPLTRAASQVQGEVESSSLGDEIENEGGYENTYDDGNIDENLSNTDTDQDKSDPFSEDVKHKIKIKGQDVEVNGAQLKKLAEQGGRMYQAMEEAAKYRKYADEFRGLLDNVRTSPDAMMEFMGALGHDFDRMAHEHVLKKMNYANMNEAERKAYDYEQKLKKYEQRDAEEQKRQQAEQQKQRAEMASQTVKQEVFEYFSQRFDSKAMQSPQNLKLLADTLENVLGSFDDRTGSYTPIAKAFEIVQNRIRADKQSMLSDLSDDELANLPDNHPLVQKIRQRLVQRHKSRQSGRPERTTQNQQPRQASQPKQPKNIGLDDAFAQLEKRWK